MNESCLTWLNHVPHRWGMSHMNESWLSFARADLGGLGSSHMNAPCHTWKSHVTYEWGMSHMNESRLTWMSHATSRIWEDSDAQCVMSHMSESCHPRMGMSHMNESCLTWLSHVPHEWVTSRPRSGRPRIHGTSNHPCPWKNGRRYALCLCVRVCLYVSVLNIWIPYISHTSNHPCPWKSGRRCVLYLCVRVCLYASVCTIGFVHISNV